MSIYKPVRIVLVRVQILKSSVQTNGVVWVKKYRYRSVTFCFSTAAAMAADSASLLKRPDKQTNKQK